MCVYVCVCGIYVDPLDLEFQVVVSHLIELLGLELKSSLGEASWLVFLST